MPAEAVEPVVEATEVPAKETVVEEVPKAEPKKRGRKPKKVEVAAEEPVAEVTAKETAEEAPKAEPKKRGRKPKKVESANV